MKYLKVLGWRFWSKKVNEDVSKVSKNKQKNNLDSHEDLLVIEKVTKLQT
jgi:hypothetical protein